jgi:hypothetical protein
LSWKRGSNWFRVNRNLHYRSPRSRCRAETFRQIETALLSQIDVDEHHIGVMLLDATERLGAGRRHAHDRDPLALQQATRTFKEP